MTQSQDSDRLQQVGATFLNYYYGLLVTQPSRLSQFYTADAVFEHHGKRATGDSISSTLQQVYQDPKQAPSFVKVEDLRVEANGPQFDLHVRGTFRLRGKNTVQNFQHSLSMAEHAPNTFGVLNDILSSVRRASPPPQLDSWAAETPPMFANKKEEVIPPLEDIPPPIHKALPVEEPETTKKSMTMAERIRATQLQANNASASSNPTEAASETKLPTKTTDSPKDRNGPPPYRQYDLFVRGFPEKITRQQLLDALKLDPDLVGDVKLVGKQEKENNSRGSFGFIQLKASPSTKEKLVSSLIQATQNNQNTVFPELEVETVRPFAKPSTESDRRPARKTEESAAQAQRRRGGPKSDEIDGGYRQTAS